jgi:hypothetical protein
MLDFRRSVNVGWAMKLASQSRGLRSTSGRLAFGVPQEDLAADDGRPDLCRSGRRCEAPVVSMSTVRSPRSAASTRFLDGRARCWEQSVGPRS